jgi:hypothetical protein
VRLFEGYEAEGQYKGLLTLFISGDVPFEKIKDTFYVAKHRQLYFGADKLSTVNWITVKAVLSMVYKSPCIVSVETNGPIPEEFSNWIHCIFKINGLDEIQLGQLLSSMPSHRTSIKFDTSGCTYVAPLDRFMWNQQSDTYKDKELWRQE